MMKRLAIILTGILLIISLTACSRLNTRSVSDVDETSTPVVTSPMEPGVFEPAETIVVHNARELMENLGSNKHFLLAPDGDYDLCNIDETSPSGYSQDRLSKLENVIIEGQGEAQVDFLTDSLLNSVLYLAECKNITLKNYGHPYYSLELSVSEGYSVGLKVSALDGTICRHFNGDQFARVQHANQDQIDAVIAYIKSQGSPIPQNAIYRAFCVADEYIAFFNNFTDATYATYHISEVNGELVAEPFIEYEGD